jgi:hypothetical protein
MTSKTLIAPLGALFAAAIGTACVTDTEDDAPLTLRSSQFTAAVQQPKANTPIDIYLQPGQVLAFQGEFFTLAAPGELPDPLPSTKAKVALSGDVVAIQHAGKVKRFSLAGIDAAGQLVAVRQSNVAFDVQSAFETIPEGWLPNPGGMMQCANDAAEEAQECVSLGASYGCCLTYQAQAVAMCYTNIWGHSIDDAQGSIWASLCGTDGGGGGGGGGGDAGGDDGGGTECGDDWEFVEDVPVEVNGEECSYTGWSFSAPDPDSGDCVTVVDLTLGNLVCAGLPSGGNLPAPGQTEPA